MSDLLQVILRQLDGRSTLQPLTPTRVWDPDLDELIATMKLARTAEDDQSIALLAGLHLRNDSLDRSHSYAQMIEHDPIGSYWHAIMHRMEQDYANSKYWVRRVGNHPVIKLVQNKTAALLYEHDLPRWNGEHFVDLVKQQETGHGTEKMRSLLEQLQHIEITQLFQHTYNNYTKR